MRKPLKQIKKLYEKKCYFCGEDQPDLLDAHRIIFGRDKGKYNWDNILVLCANHHRLIHSGKIKIDRKYLTSSGKWLLHYFENNQEHWL